MVKTKTVLVTGASSGIGQAIAILLAQKGYHVFGTSRYPISRIIPQVEMIGLDVRSDESVEACIRTVMNKAGRLDILINNAGYELGGALEETSLDEATGQFDTNFLGVLRMIKAALPIMREQNQGQIINISSLAGLVGIPFLGMYSASKFALEGYSESLRHEVKPFNIHVSMVEPSFLKTPMMDARQLAAHPIGDYDQWRKRALAAVRKFEENAPGPELVANTVLKIIKSKSPRLRYILGQQATVVSNLRRFLPEAMLEQGIRGSFNLDERK
ncbi:MAG: SDR family NAD(P)-dependent oxidoreductase [Anaerolineales bacterium]|nr:SDR family NAD(P)-dependent oxidoreductase [Anaerolineales bacterium]